MTAAGDHIRLLVMEDLDALPPGATGVVRAWRNKGKGPPFEQVDVAWDPPHEGRTLMLVPEVDRWEVIEGPEGVPEGVGARSSPDLPPGAQEGPQGRSEGDHDDAEGRS
jgi:hypothetical protein